MNEIYLPYENREALSAEEFFRDPGKADTDGLAVLEEDCRASDFPSDPCAKLLGLPEVFDRPATEPTNELQKRAKVVETRIGSSVVVAELDEHYVVMRTFLKGTR